ncbi:hypothetical protein B0T19DRAFT_445489 [Cercophora scortea]|uniref:Uncharacterized protein n=1 Tax=Cercophora scortea TaxID=314031 RepID=A0AAE0I8K0_9PEZI|nr:hypothetical protein B0T19DRAFT_445489 [Cercophora scortea]
MEQAAGVTRFRAPSKSASFIFLPQILQEPESLEQRMARIVGKLKTMNMLSQGWKNFFATKSNEQLAAEILALIPPPVLKMLAAPRPPTVAELRALKPCPQTPMELGVFASIYMLDIGHAVYIDSTRVTHNMRVSKRVYDTLSSSQKPSLRQE